MGIQEALVAAVKRTCGCCQCHLHKIVYRVELGGNVDAHQVIVSVEVGPEDKDAGIEAIWPAGICTNIVI